MKRNLWPVLCLLLLLTACRERQEGSAAAESALSAVPPSPIWADATPDPDSVELQEAELEEEEPEPRAAGSGADASSEKETADAAGTETHTQAPSETEKTEESARTETCAHGSLETVKTDATCTENGCVRYACRACGKVLKELTLSSPGHSWVITAEEKGHASVCSRCGQKTRTEAHTFQNGVCTVCGYGCTHSYADTATEATCLQEGYMTHTCTLCGYHYTDHLTPAAGHSYVLRIDADGKNVYVCTVCGEQMEAPDNDSTEEKRSIDLPEVILE